MFEGGFPNLEKSQCSGHPQLGVWIGGLDLALNPGPCLSFTTKPPTKRKLKSSERDTLWSRQDLLLARSRSCRDGSC